MVSSLLAVRQIAGSVVKVGDRLLRAVRHIVRGGVQIVPRRMPRRVNIMLRIVRGCVRALAIRVLFDGCGPMAASHAPPYAASATHPARLRVRRVPGCPPSALSFEYPALHMRVVRRSLTATTVPESGA